MINFIQPLVNLTNANLQATSRFIQAPEMAELTKSSLDKYGKLLRESMMQVTQSNAMDQWMRQTMQNFSRFNSECTQSMFGLMTQAPQIFASQMKDFSHQVEQGIGATIRAADFVEDETEEAIQARSKSKQHRQVG